MCTDIVQLLSGLFHFLYEMFFIFFFLNAILFTLFLLKSLFFKPKFVENRLKTISIDPDINKSELISNQIETCSSPSCDQAENCPTERVVSMNSVVTKFVQNLYSNDAIDAEYVSPCNELIKLKRKICTGYIGTLYEIQVGVQENCLPKLSTCEGPLCAKIINFRLIRELIAEINGVAGNTSAEMPPLTFIAYSDFNVKRDVLMYKYCTLYKKFLNSYKRLDSKRMLSHPHIAFYKQVLVNNENLTLHTKYFEDILQLDNEQLMKLPNQILLVMPFAKCNLRTVLIRQWGNFDLNTSTDFASQIALGLNFLHEVIGLAHLNLKPENILLFETDLAADKSRPLSERYTLKISDCCNSLLLPTFSKVLTLGIDTDASTSIYAMGSYCKNKLSDKFLDRVKFDQHCYAVTLLILLVGYECFHKTFILPQFPNALVCPLKSHLIQTIEEYDRKAIPIQFVDLFKLIFDEAREIKTESIVKHPALESKK